MIKTGPVTGRIMTICKMDNLSVIIKPNVTKPDIKFKIFDDNHIIYLEAAKKLVTWYPNEA